MRNIYENVAKHLGEEYGRTDITSRKIKRMVKEGNYTVPYNINGAAGMVDIEAMIQTELEKTCEKMVEEMLKVSAPWVKVKITDYKFFGEEISTEYAIVAGLFKSLSYMADK